MGSHREFVTFMAAEQHCELNQKSILLSIQFRQYYSNMNIGAYADLNVNLLQT